MRIGSLEDLIAMLTVMDANLQTYQTAVGASNADRVEVSEDLGNAISLRDFVATVTADKETAVGIKNGFFRGDSIAPFPVFPIGAPPFELIPNARERAYARNRRFKANCNNNKEIMTALGIYESGDSPSPDNVKPTLTAEAAAGGYAAAIIVGNRAGSDMWKVTGRKPNSEKREEIDSGTGKSLDITIDAPDNDAPIRIELQIQLYKNNQPYGVPSDSVYVTFNP